MRNDYLRIHGGPGDPDEDRLSKADGAVHDLEAAVALLRAYFNHLLDHEQGLTFEELYSVDSTLELCLEATRNRVDAIFVAERAAAGLPPLEEKLPGLRKDPEGGES